MEEKLTTGNVMRAYVSRGLIIFALFVVLGVGFLSWKGPSFVKSVAKATIENKLAPYGVKDVEIDTIKFGWWRIYLRDIRSKSTDSSPKLSIQEVDIALSAFLNVKAIDVVGAMYELKESGNVSLSKEYFQDKLTHILKSVIHLKKIKLPSIGMRDCLLIIPSSKGLVKLPFHVVTETTVTRNKVFTIDWGEHGDHEFSGQFVLDLAPKGMTIDIHSVNIDVNTPGFKLIAPEISLWGTTVADESESYKIDGFAKINHLALARYGSSKQPLEFNLEGEGTPDNLVVDECTIMTTGPEKNIVELDGNFDPNKFSGQLAVSTQITQLSKLWDFTPLLATHSNDKVSLGGKVKMTSEIVWEEGKLKTSVLALHLKGGTIAREGFSIVGTNAKILFDKLHPLTTKGEQKVTAKKLSVSGIELKNLAFKCLFDGNGLFQIKQFTAETLGGNLKAHRFQRLAKSTQPAFQFETDFHNIEFAEILKLTDLQNIKGHARLAGNASMRYASDEGLDIVQAELHSISESGIIQYKSGQGTEGADLMNERQGQGANMAFQVLDNLNFTLFSVRLEHAADNPAEMQAIVKMLGSNPRVLNGYPFEFNIVTTGKLKDLVMNTLQHMKPPTDINQLKKAIKETEKAKIEKKARRLEAKTTEDIVPVSTPEPKAVKAPKSVKRIKRVKKTKSRKVKKASKKVKNIKATKIRQIKNGKLKDG